MVSSHSEASPRNTRSSIGSATDSPTYDFKKKKTPQKVIGSVEKRKLRFRELEELHIKLNVYDLVWDVNSKKPKNAGLADLGFGFYHSGVEMWGKEISFGHSKRYTSGVFAVKPKAAETLMHHTRFREAIDIATVQISRYSVDRLLNRLALKYRSDSYDILRCNCNHFTEELCTALCGKSIPEWINRPAKLGASAVGALEASIGAVNSLFSFLAPKPIAGQKRPGGPGGEDDAEAGEEENASPRPESAGRQPVSAAEAAARVEELRRAAGEVPAAAEHGAIVLTKKPRGAASSPTATPRRRRSSGSGRSPR